MLYVFDKLANLSAIMTLFPEPAPPTNMTGTRFFINKSMKKRKHVVSPVGTKTDCIDHIKYPYKIIYVFNICITFPFYSYSLNIVIWTFSIYIFVLE